MNLVSSTLHFIRGVFTKIWNWRHFSLTLCLILRIIPASANQYYSLTSALFNKSKEDSCGIVKVHSLSKQVDGSTFHQEGIGWVVFAESQVYLLTPFHVVVNSEQVYAECKGQLTRLQMPSTDPEKDLAMFAVDARLITDKKWSPLLWIAADSEKAKMDRLLDQSDPKKALANPNFSRSDLKDMQNFMLGMDSFGVALPAAKSDDNNFIMSVPGSNMVQGFVDSDQQGISQLLRIENFGIRPGLSGAPLFGVPDSSVLRSLNVGENSLGYSVPIEIIPKVLLGMVTKTRVNGAETVAVSLPDIYDFIDAKLLRPYSLQRTEKMQVHYDVVGGGKETSKRLRSFIRLFNADGLQSKDYFEVCSEEYKNSADLRVLKGTELIKKIDLLEPPKENVDAATKFILKDGGSKSPPEKQDKKMLRGGGEYGEGGDAFASDDEKYLTSAYVVGRFQEMDLKLKVKVKDESPSMGLYLKPGTCRRQGIWQGNELINSVTVPGMGVYKLANNEDLRKFISIYGSKANELIEVGGKYSTRPFFEETFKYGLSVDIPLTTIDYENSNSPAWRPGDRLYFKEKKVAVRTNGDSALQISSSRFMLHTMIKGLGARGKNNGWIQVLFQKGTWQGRYALGAQCSVQMDPAKFTQISPWLVEYNDGKNLMNIEMASRDRLVTVTFKKVECAEYEKLALAEIEIYPTVGGTAVIGTHRTAVIPIPIDFGDLAKKFPPGSSAGAK